MRDSRNLCWTLITLQVQYRIYLSISSMMASLLCSCVQINEYKRKMLMFFAIYAETMYIVFSVV